MDRFTEVEKVIIYAVLKEREVEVKEKIEELKITEESYNSNDMKFEYDMITKYLYDENKLLESILKKFKDIVSI